jgi:GNAT superfamily N-acetyltransferase
MNPATPQAPLELETLRWTETLLDRSQVLIRPMLASDHEAERAFIEGLSPQARRFRFLGQIASPSEALLDQLTDVDFDHDVAFVATPVGDAQQRIVGVGRYCVDRDGGRCEIAVTVADEWTGHGLGTALTRHLIEIARARGIRSMYSIDSSENFAMAEVAKHLGFTRRIDPDDSSQCIHTLNLSATT